MKKTLFTVSLLLGCIFAGNAQEDSYRIEGRLGQPINTQVILMADTEKGMIELSDVTITNGNFELTGRMPEMTVVHLMTSKKDVVLTTIMLENANYSITAGSTGLIIEGGGEAQKIWKEFEDLNNYLMQTQQQYDGQARKATSPAQFMQLQQEFQKVVEKVQAEETELIKKYNNSVVTACVIASRLQGIDEAKLFERYGMLGENAKSSFYGKRRAAEMDKLQKVAVGAIAPDFTAPLADGGVLSLYETKAKVKVIDFWASWCSPCRQENVNLLKIYKRYRPKGLEIISFSLDNNKHAWLGAIGQDGINWKNVSDLKGGQASEITAEYRVTAIPCTFILDEENRIVAKNLRGKELEKKIDEMLKKKKD